MQNLMSSHAVADFFFLHTNANSGDSITNLKLQKLVYYGQAWHLAIADTPIFGDRIEAWTHGPVVPDLYSRFRGSQWSALDPTALITDPFNDLSDSVRGILTQVYQTYGGYGGKHLEALTHSEDPWLNARAGLGPLERSNVEITHDAMRKFYRARLPN